MSGWLEGKNSHHHNEHIYQMEAISKIELSFVVEILDIPIPIHFSLAFFFGGGGFFSWMIWVFTAYIKLGLH